MGLFKRAGERTISRPPLLLLSRVRIRFLLLFKQAAAECPICRFGDGRTDGRVGTVAVRTRKAGA